MIERTFALWETPLAVLRPPSAPALNARLLEVLLPEAATTPGITVANAGGAWHSIPDLALRRDGPFPELMKAIVDGVRAVFDPLAASRGFATAALPLVTSIQSWAMICPPGGYVTLHDHADASHFSVAWYVDAGDADLERHPDSGTIVFQDPRRVPSRIAGFEIHPPAFQIHPESGMLVVFPGWLAHWVHPYHGARPRVVVSANLRLEAR